MVIVSPGEFLAAVHEHRLKLVALDAAQLELARTAVQESGLLFVGEPHGARETPSVLWSLASALNTRAVAFEWSHEELDDVVQEFLRAGSLDFEKLWSLPESAELFCGDGRITAGHFALLQRLRDEGRLDQVILFDRLDPEPAPDGWLVRDGEMAERLLETWDRRYPLLALAGAFHARLDADGETMAAHIDRQVRLRPAMIDYAAGQCWSRGLHDVAGPMPPAPITLRVRAATPAVVPGKA